MIPTIQVKATAHEQGNQLIVRAPEEIQKQIEKMLEVLDKPNNRKTLYIRKINYISANDLSIIIQNIIKYKNKPNPGVAISDSRTNKLILLEEPENMADLQNIIEKLDTKTNQAQPVFIIKLKNAKADNIQNLLNQIK